MFYKLPVRPFIREKEEKPSFKFWYGSQQQQRSETVRRYFMSYLFNCWSEQKLERNQAKSFFSFFSFLVLPLKKDSHNALCTTLTNFILILQFWKVATTVKIAQ
jgi:hypothetical protein